MIPLMRFLPRGVQRFLANTGTHRFKGYCGGFNRVAKKLGVEGVPSFACLLMGDLSLVTEAPEVLGISAADLEAWRPGPVGYRAGMRLEYSGPLFAELDRPVPPRVTEFLARSGPVAYVAITSSDAEMVRKAVRGLHTAGLRVLVAGTVHALAELESPEVMVEGVLPSHRVMPHVALAVTAGGQGSVQCAMAAGTPLLALPLQPEQDFNAQVVERHGAGVRLSPRALGTPTLAEHARALLDRPSFRDNARKIQAIYAKLDGPGLAADAIVRCRDAA